MGINKRRYKRLLSAGNIISVRYRRAFCLRKKDALMIEDISGGGIRLCLTERLRPGTKMRLEIRLPGIKETLPAKGEVAWLIEAEARKHPKACFHTGIRFTEIDPLSICKIYSYFQEHNITINLV